MKVSFIFRDLEFYANFRDLTGIEARYAHKKVEAEVSRDVEWLNKFYSLR